jgi:chromosome partitioning protein
MSEKTKGQTAKKASSSTKARAQKTATVRDEALADKVFNPRILSIANQKGGVGKTTTAINLATAMCAVGKTVLLIDLDSQGNASTGLGIRRSDIRLSTYDILFAEAKVTDIAMKTKVPGLYVAPSSIHLAGAEIELVTSEEREFRLRNALRTNLPYDYVIIDCPPSLNLLTLNAMVASDSVVVPLQCEFYALEGLSQLVKTIERVQKHFNEKLDIQGIVLTMYDKRNNLANMVAQDVREHFGEKVYRTMIPRNVRVSEAPSFGLPAIVYDMKCPGAEAYIRLAGEVLKREKILNVQKRSSDDVSVQKDTPKEAAESRKAVVKDVAAGIDADSEVAALAADAGDTLKAEAF